MNGWRQTFFAGCETLFRWLGTVTHGATKACDRLADWCAERAR